MVYKCFDKKTSATRVNKFTDSNTSGVAIKREIVQNKELAKETHKPIIRKFEKRKVHSSLIDIIWNTD